MAYLGRKTVAGRRYYYLEESLRLNGTVQKRERFVGEKLPPDIGELKLRFSREVRSELLYPRLDMIKKAFASEERSLPDPVREKSLRAFAVRFTYDTNRIEGSTLSLRETAELLEAGITPARKAISDVKEAESHWRVFREVLGTRRDLSLRLVLYWHHRLFCDTKPDIAGKLRDYQVYISGVKYTPPSPVEVHPLMTEMLAWYNRNKSRLHPVEISASLHQRFESIHPFGDGNGRVGRLIMNSVLHRNGWPMLNIPYETRRGYYNALERSQTRRDEDVFVRWFIRRYLSENARFLPAGRR
ncbi:MAG: Fic family protein [Euryarchaeota archaeon]|nr:Fic family protein [Euryarchaeota archaeon]